MIVYDSVYKAQVYDKVYLYFNGKSTILDIKSLYKQTKSRKWNLKNQLKKKLTKIPNKLLSGLMNSKRKDKNKLKISKIDKS